MGLAAKVMKPGFGRGGDRTLEQQLIGLQPMIERVQGKSVLDVGCAEGLIGMHLYDAGAAEVHGVERRQDYVREANRLKGDRAGCTFEAVDANGYTPAKDYDIVIMLAVLHKLDNPSACCMRFVDAARELVVMRLPPKTAPVIIDDRSNGQPFDMDHTMKCAGFQRFITAKGHLGEWVGYYAREMM